MSASRLMGWGPATCIAALPVLIWIGHPSVALLAGAVIALTADRRPLEGSSSVARYALQTAIVLLGFKLDLQTLWSLSADYTSLVAAYVLATLALGAALGRVMTVEPPSSKLISAGTAICGGTAIATLSAVVRAEPRQTAVALAIVFLLNVVALLTFPWVGRWLELSQEQFGLWAALAVHDTSSVVATAAVYGERAAEVATTIKLGRTLWLIPLAFVLALVEQRRTADAAGGMPRLRVPGFIALFVAAAGLGSWIGLSAAVTDTAGAVSKALLVVALFFVGTELTRTVVRQIRGRALWQALILWVAVIPATLAAVMWVA